LREDRTYRDWYGRVRPGEPELAVMRRRARLLGYQPRVSLLLVVEDADEVWIKASVASVLDQIYPSVELCICDNASVRPHVEAVLRHLAASDDRLSLCSLREKGSRTWALNEALGLATGEYVAALDPGDELTAEALLEVVEALTDADDDLVYTDEDEVDVAGRPSNPTFKPPWSPDLLLSANYIGRLGVVRRSLVEELGGFRGGTEGAEEYDLFLRVAERTPRIRHLPGVRYHRRRLPQQPRPMHIAAASGVARAALARRGLRAAVETGLAPGSLRVVQSLPKDMTATVILMTNRPPEGVRRELEASAGYSIQSVLANGHRRGTLAPSLALPARTFNLAAQRATGEYLIFLEEGVKPTTHGWLSEMLRQAQRPEVGLVSGRLMDKENQGVPVGKAPKLAQLTGEPQEAGGLGGDYLPLQEYPGNFPASGWMCVRRSVFMDAGGFDEENLPAAFYDLDLSFRLEEAGLLNVYTPYAGAAYGGESFEPPEEEIAYMWVRWWSALIRILYYAGSPAQRGDDRAALDTVLAASAPEKVWWPQIRGGGLDASCGAPVAGP